MTGVSTKSLPGYRLKLGCSKLLINFPEDPLFEREKRKMGKVWGSVSSSLSYRRLLSSLLLTLILDGVSPFFGHRRSFGGKLRTLTSVTLLDSTGNSIQLGVVVDWYQTRQYTQLFRKNESNKSYVKTYPKIRMLLFLKLCKKFFSFSR